MWDWGGGNFKTPLEAAALTGGRAITECVLGKEARPCLDAAAMPDQSDLIRLERFRPSPSLMSLLRLALFALGVSLLAGCSSPSHRAASTTASGHQQSQTGGTGSPTVVFEAGAGDGLETWSLVYPEVSSFTTAFAYSRRGYGMGLPVLSHRDGKTIIDELRALLATQGIHPPYVLVGHSIGGLYMQLYAKLYPNEVVGVVLVDPTAPDQLERMRNELPRNYAIVQTLLALNATRTMSAEIRASTETSRQWHAAGAFPRCPMILLSATRANAMDGGAFPGFMQRLHAELIRSWPGAEQRRVDSRHYVQREAPAQVVNAIRTLVDRARGGSRTALP